MSQNQQQNIDALIKRVLTDIRIEMTDEFDQNFTRQAFFSQAWERRSSPVRDNGAALLIDSGSLRRSITSKLTDNSVVFESSLPYSAIHNEGGEIVVTARMKRFFWAKYYEATGAFTRRKNGERSRSKKNLKLSTLAEFWMHMALMKVGQSIRIPRRQFLGVSPEVEKLVNEIIEDNLDEYFEHDFNIVIK